MAVYGETEHLGFRRDAVEIARRIMWARDDGLGVNCGVRLVAFCNNITCELVSDDNGVTFQLDGTGNGDERFLDEVKKHVKWTSTVPADPTGSNEQKFACLVGCPEENDAIFLGKTPAQKQKIRGDKERDACTRLEIELHYSGFLSSFKGVNGEPNGRAEPNLLECLRVSDRFKDVDDNAFKKKPELMTKIKNAWEVFRCTRLRGVRCYFEPVDETLVADPADIVENMAQGKYERELIDNTVFVLEIPPPAKIMYYGDMLLFDAPFVGVLSDWPGELPIGGLRCSAPGNEVPSLCRSPWSNTLLSPAK